LFLPQIADGGGYKTQIIAFDTSDTGGSVSIVFYDENGIPQRITFPP